jgi:hypothetical protein
VTFRTSVRWNLADVLQFLSGLGIQRDQRALLCGNIRNVINFRFILVLMPALFHSSAFAPPQSKGSAERGFSVQADCGTLSVVPIADGALRVMCAPQRL